MNLRKVLSAKSPRNILEADFKSLGAPLPIKGGWGYSKEDVWIIDKNDSVANKYFPFDGIKIEYIFIEKRIYEELIIFRQKGDTYYGIKWNLIEQKLMTFDNKMYDYLSFKVTALHEIDWFELKSEFESNNGFESSETELRAHFKKRDERIASCTSEYWFDITSFY